MNKRIEDYGLIGNMVSCALVGRDGSMDWLCLPHFDSDACFAALLGTPEHGRWLIAPKTEIKQTTRRYLPNTAVLETTFETESGIAQVIDFMPLSKNETMVEVVRMVRGVKGQVNMRMELVLRFGYGKTVPWVHRRDYGISAVAGPDAVELLTPVRLHGEKLTTCTNFTIEMGQDVPFTLVYHPSQSEPSFIGDRQIALSQTVDWWREWSNYFRFDPSAPIEWKEAVIRSLITLKALTFRPSGGLVAAPTTSLPEEIGGERNWDYRFCWIRDATMTLYTFLKSGYLEEAKAFREWLLRTTAGHPDQMQIMYGLRGERRLTEVELPWLPGYEQSRPVRIGNGAHGQTQLDVYGNLMEMAHAARHSSLGPSHDSWRLQWALLKNLERIWCEPDEGIWEIRGEPRHFTYSKIMSWVAFDRAIKGIEQFSLDGPVDRWRKVRDQIRANILANGYDQKRNTFVQAYGYSNLDASLLLIGKTGFLEQGDPRFQGTVEAIERELIEGGFVLRYRSEQTNDGLMGEEGTFLICSFWLVDAYMLLNRYDDAAALFKRLLSVRNDLGLLAEEYDPRAGRQLGNFPQAFSHLGLINAAHSLLGIYTLSAPFKK